MKSIIVSFLFFLSLGVTANDKELKICLTGSTEKALPKYGEAFVNGANLAINELNAVEKSRVQLSVNYYDSNPLAPITKLDELRKDACDALIGFSTGNDLISIEESLKKDPILTLSIYGDPQARFNETSYLRTMQPSSQDLVNHLFSKLPFKIKKDSKVLLITAADRSEMTSYKEAYLNKLKDFGNVTQVEVIEQTHDLREFENILRKKIKWDYIILLTRSLIAAELSDLVHKESNPIILGTKYFGSSDLPAFFNYLKNKKVQAYISRQNCSCDSNENYQNLRSRYKQTYNLDSMSISIDSYDATKFVLQSLRASKLNPRQVLSYLNSKQANFQGVSSLVITEGLKLSSTRRFLIKIDENGYKEVK